MISQIIGKIHKQMKFKRYILGPSYKVNFVMYSVFLFVRVKHSTFTLKLNMGITHVFSCINICGVPRKLFEHEAIRPSVQTSSEGPGKC